jgi:ABC-type transport system substrate-binding protein
LPSIRRGEKKMKFKALFMTIVLICSVFVSCLTIGPVKSTGGLVGWWRFDEGSGTMASDDSGNGNNGILSSYNDPVLPQWATGKYGSALKFDGNNDFVLVPDSSSLDFSSAVTLMAWVYLPAGAHYPDSMMVSKNALNGATNLLLGIHDDVGHIRFGLGSGSDGNTITFISSGDVPRNVWTNVAATYDDSLMKIYINGTLDSIDSWTGGFNTNNGADLCIGASNYALHEYCTNATIDDVRIYNMALTQLEIQTDMEGSYPHGPGADNLYIKYYSSTGACVAALQNGTVDLTNLELTGAQMDVLNNSNIRSVISPGSNIYEFDFNNNATIPSDGNLTSPTYYRAFRQGLACLVNKNYIVNQICSFATRADPPIYRPTDDYWVDWSISEYDSYGNLLGNYPYEFNSTLANQYFNQSGFTEGSANNPYYDPSFPGSLQHLRLDPQTSTTMPPLIFYIRNDDPYRLEAGRMLKDDLRKMGIPVNAMEANAPTCRQHVMGLLDYNIYTGSWVGGSSTDLLSMYQTPPPGIFNSTYLDPYYSQFKNATYDQSLDKLINASNLGTARAAAIECQKILIQEAACAWVYCLDSVMGYRNISGVVNFRGGRIDNTWTFLVAHPRPLNSTSETINYGLSSPPTSLNVITDYYATIGAALNYPADDCLDLIYDTLLSYSPVDGTPGNTYGYSNRGGTMPWLAKDWQMGNWSSPYQAGKNLTELTFYLRDGIKWQDGIELNSTDVKFTIDYLKALGYDTTLNTNVADVYSVITPDAHTVVVYENVSNIWTLDLIGKLPILPKHIFQSITNVTGYYPGIGQGLSASKVLIGSGLWKYVSNNASTLILKANRDFFLETPPAGEVDFCYHWEMGSWGVDAMDATMVGEAFNSTGSFIPSAKWDPRADIYGNGVIDSNDVSYVTSQANCFNITWGSSGQYVPPQPTTNCTMYVDTSNSQILKGENFTAYVKATNIYKLSGYQFELRYDPSSLNCLSLTLSPLFNSQIEIMNETTGLILGGITLKGATPPISNSTLTLATIEFNATNGGGSRLHLLDTELAQYGAPLMACQLIPHRTIDKGIMVEVNVPTGKNVVVSPAPNAQVTFNKTTAAGWMTLNVTQPPSTTLKSTLDSLFVDIQTNATYQGNVTLQFTFNPTRLTLSDKEAMRMWLWNAASSSYRDVTTRVNTTTNTVYGVSPHLSCFAITCSLSITGSSNQPVQTVLQTPSSPPGGLPPWLQALVYYDITPQWGEQENVTLRLKYDPSTLRPNTAQFLQMWLWDTTLSQWVDITTKVDTVNNVLYGFSPHLSCFAITCLQLSTEEGGSPLSRDLEN